MTRLIGIGAYSLLLGHLYALNPTVATAVAVVTIAASLIFSGKGNK